MELGESTGEAPRWQDEAVRLTLFGGGREDMRERESRVFYQLKGDETFSPGIKAQYLDCTVVLRDY